MHALAKSEFFTLYASNNQCAKRQRDSIISFYSILVQYMGKRRIKLDGLSNPQCLLIFSLQFPKTITDDLVELWDCPLYLF